MTAQPEPNRVGQIPADRREEVLAETSERGFPVSNASRWLAWALLACSLAVVLYVRVRWLDFPLQRDEGEYAYAGQLMLDGVPPYKLAYNMKMPGIYAAYAAVMAVFGQTTAGIHVGLLLVHLASLVLLFLLAKRFFGLSGAAVATSAYTLMTLSPAVVGMAAQATHFVVLPALLGILMLFRFEEKRRWQDCLASGLFFGIAFLMKQHGVFLGLFGGLYLTWLCIREEVSAPSSRMPTLRIRNVALRLGSFSVGCVLPFLAVCVWMKIDGVFPQFWFWTFSYAREYVSIIPFAEGLRLLHFMLSRLFHAAGALWLMAAFGLVLLCTVKMELDRRIFLAGFFVSSFLTVCPGYFFRPHYFVLFMPAVALLIGFAVSWCEAWLSRIKSRPWLRYLPLLIGLLACAESLYPYHKVLFTLPLADACFWVYGDTPFPESPDIARYIERNTKPNDRIAVLGSEPQIYFFAHRLSSTGYIYAYPLMEPQPFAKQMQSDMIREIEENPPTYLVHISMPGSWAMRPFSSHLLLDWLGGYVDKNMQLVGLIQYIDHRKTETVWGSEAATTPLRAKLYISIYKRLDSPP